MDLYKEWLYNVIFCALLAIPLFFTSTTLNITDFYLSPVIAAAASLQEAQSADSFFE